MFPQTGGLGEFCFRGVLLLRRIREICVKVSVWRNCFGLRVYRFITTEFG